MGVGADCNVFKDSIICKTSQQNCDLLRQKTNYYYLNIIRILAFVPVFHISNIELNKFLSKLLIIYHSMGIILFPLMYIQNKVSIRL